MVDNFNTNYKIMNIRETAYLLQVVANSGQSQPECVSDETVAKLMDYGYIDKLKARNTLYYYPTILGTQIAERINKVTELLDLGKQIHTPTNKISH
jgi:hypothetical protein